jgi:hypothetical protein
LNSATPRRVYSLVDDEQHRRTIAAAGADPQPTAPVAKMLDALDELIAATRRVAVETSTSADRLTGARSPQKTPSLDARRSSTLNTNPAARPIDQSPMPAAHR